MRRLKKFVAIVASAAIILSAFCISASADMDAPFFMEYDVTVSNQNGAKIFDGFFNSEADEKEIKVIPFGTKLTVNSEYLHNDVIYIGTRYEGNYVYVNADDVAKLSDSVDSSKGRKLSEPFTVIVIAEDGLAIRKGPADSYEEVARVPYGTEITCGIMDNGDPVYDAWGYVSYDGKEGWADLYQFDSNDKNNVARKLDSNSDLTGEVMVISEGAKLSKNPDCVSESNPGNKYITKEIPVGTVLKYTYYYYFVKSTYVYTEYDGVKGWMITDEDYDGEDWKDTTALGQKKTITCNYPDGAKLYSGPFDSGEYLGEILKNGEQAVSDMNASDLSQPKVINKKISDGDYQTSYYFFETYRITLNGKTGWVTFDRGYESPEETPVKYYALEKTSLYADKSSDSEVLAEIPQFAELTQDENEEEGEKKNVSFNGISGWISTDKLMVKKNTGAEFEHEISVYKSSDFSGKPIMTVPRNALVQVVYESLEGDILYVSYNNQSGWVKISSAETAGKNIAYKEITGIFSEEDFDTYNSIGSEYYPEEIHESTTAAMEEEEKPESGVSAGRIVVCCAAASAIICIASLVTINLINKKKKEQE